MKRTNEAIERDLAALIKHGNDLRRDSAELSRTVKELLSKAARLKRSLTIRLQGSHQSVARELGPR
jgi:hypothetical protein